MALDGSQSPPALRAVVVGDLYCFQDASRGPDLTGFAFELGRALKQCGVMTNIAARVGPGVDGDAVFTLFSEHRLSTDLLERDDMVATSTLVASGNGEVSFSEGGASDYLCREAPIISCLEGADLLCFNAGILRRPTSKHTLIEILEASDPELLRVFFANFADYKSTPESSVVRSFTNQAEVLVLRYQDLPLVCAAFSLPPLELIESISAFRARAQLKAVYVLPPGGPLRASDSGASFEDADRRASHEVATFELFARILRQLPRSVGVDEVCERALAAG